MNVEKKHHFKALSFTSSLCLCHRMRPCPNCIPKHKHTHTRPCVSKDVMDYNNQTIFHESQLAARSQSHLNL